MCVGSSPDIYVQDMIIYFAGVPASMQKIMFKGKMRDDATLREHEVKKNAKIMLVGSTVNDVMSVSAPDMKALKEEEKKEKAAATEPLTKQKVNSIFHFFRSVRSSLILLIGYTV